MKTGIYGHENVKRAIEVAIVSGVGLFIVGRRGFGTNEIDRFKKSIEAECRGYTWVKQIEISENDTRDDVIKTAKELRSKSGHMLICTAENPHFDTYILVKGGKRGAENISDVEKRILDGREHELKNDDLSSSCVALLKNAFEKLNLNYDYADTIIRVAIGIAKLDKADKIEAWHIAEAIQYCPKMTRVEDVLNYWQLEQSF